MANLDYLFPGTQAYRLERLPADSDGGHYNKAPLDLPLEEIIATKLQDAGIQPPYEA